MLDRKSEILLQFLESLPEKTFNYLSDVEYPDELGDNKEFFALVKHLEETGYVQVIRAKSGNDYGVRPSHKGANRREFHRLEMKERWKERIWGFFSGVLLTIAAQWVIATFFPPTPQPSIQSQTIEPPASPSEDHSSVQPLPSMVEMKISPGSL